MDQAFHEEMQRLQQYRLHLGEQIQQSNLTNSSVEVQEQKGAGRTLNEVRIKKTPQGSSFDIESLQDPLIFPGLYAPSGFDMMGILVRVRTRPNPVIAIGNVDSSVALVLCDTSLPDMPVVYCSEPFENLTGYSSNEILGRNCRFLQFPPNMALNGGNMDMRANPKNIEHDPNAEAKWTLKDSFGKGEETRVKLLNYKKSGEIFVNLLTTIPISWEDGEGHSGPGKRYIVGFQANIQSIFGSG